MGATHSIQNASRKEIYFEEFWTNIKFFVTLVCTFFDYKENKLYTYFKFVKQILHRLKVQYIAPS